MFAQIWGGEEEDAADGDFEFFGEGSPVRAGLGVCICVVCIR